MIRRVAIVLTVGLAAWVFLTGMAGAGEDGGSRQRAGAWLVYGDAERKSTDYDFYSLNPYWGYFLNDPGPGYKHAFEFCVEGFYNRHLYGFSDRYEVGIRPILRWHYGYEEFVSPFVEVSTGGFLYTNLDVPETGTKLNFTNHVGVGVNFNVSPRFHLSLAYRLRHISNAGLSHRNGGVNHQQGLAGLSYDF